MGDMSKLNSPAISCSIITEQFRLKSSLERDSLTVSALACHAADPGSNPAQGDNFFN